MLVSGACVSACCDVVVVALTCIFGRGVGYRDAFVKENANGDKEKRKPPEIYTFEAAGVGDQTTTSTEDLALRRSLVAGCRMLDVSEVALLGRI